MSLTKRNLIAKDLRTPKYRMRVAVSKKVYDRNRTKRTVQRDVYVRT
jgi:hypothetical protein